MPFVLMYSFASIPLSGLRFHFC